MDPATQVKVDIAIHTAAIPAGVALAVCLPFLVGPGRKVAARPLVGGLGLAAGYVAAHLGIAGAPARFPPTLAEHWLLAACAGGFAIGAVADLRLPSWARALLRVAAIGGGAFLLLRPLAAFSTQAVLAWSGAVAALGALIWTALDAALAGARPTAGRAEGPIVDAADAPAIPSVPAPGAALAVPAALGAVAAGLAGVNVLSGSALLGQLAGALGVVLGVLTLLVWLRPVALGSAFTGAATGALFGLFAFAHHYIAVPLAALLLLAIGILQGAWVAPALAARRIHGLRALLAGAAAAAVPVALALAFVLHSEAQQGSGPWAGTEAAATEAGGAAGNEDAYMPYDDDEAPLPY